MPTTHKHEVLIIGSGAAGLILALHLADHYRIALVCKNALLGGATPYAQGGIAAVMDPADSIEAHIEDTCNAGAGLCRLDAVRFITTEARAGIDWMISRGIPFTDAADNGATPAPYHLAQEGGHRQRRILHVKDSTGQAIARVLATQVQEHPNIDVFAHHRVLDLLTEQQRCAGAYALNEETHELIVFQAPIIVLATGGSSSLYQHSTNPDCASGDGIVMAWRQGCRVANLEFHQFHPTCFYHPQAKPFLITEAVRGEGGTLLLADGSRFMSQYDPRGELAPRDIVTRGIDSEMKKHRLQHVYLNISFKSADFIRSHFPNIYQHCLNHGYDITQAPLPVVPAAHYTCGGVVTDLQGRTDLSGLYAIGEVACTGLHGANRLASNSLLECLVLARSAAKQIDLDLKQPGTRKSILEITPPFSTAKQVDSQTLQTSAAECQQQLQSIMWEYVGIVRNNQGLAIAQFEIEALRQKVYADYAAFPLDQKFIELHNLLTLADLTIRCALARHESRGLHYNLDYPYLDKSETPKDTILEPQKPIQRTAK